MFEPSEITEPDAHKKAGTKHLTLARALERNGKRNAAFEGYSESLFHLNRHNSSFNRESPDAEAIALEKEARKRLTGLADSLHKEKELKRFLKEHGIV